MKLTFWGGAGSVTGANYLLEVNNRKFLIDCGLQQGSRYAEKENFNSFPYNPNEIEAVFITHAHIDHVGLLPKLYKNGFRGKIYSTPPTKDFAKVILEDSEHILSEEAQYWHYNPLYTLEDVEAMQGIWQTTDYHKTLDFKDLKVTFFDAGHILGSAFILIEAENKKIVFSGDLGNSPEPIIKDRDIIPPADYCLIESAYGDRLHEDVSKREDILEDAIEETVKNGGTLVIPAFAMERTQELLYHINDLVENDRIPKVPIYIDSPLAIKLTEIYDRYRNYYNDEAIQLLKKEGKSFLIFPNVYLTLTTEESKKINDVPPPKIVIAGSGMSHGGRILHHEIRYLPDPKSMILFVGYQAEGSLGRKILDGAEQVKIFGEDVPVNCQKKVISGYSAHADQKGLLDWLYPDRKILKKVYVVQGEKEASLVLAEKIRDNLALIAEVPTYGEVVDL